MFCTFHRSMIAIGLIAIWTAQPATGAEPAPSSFKISSLRVVPMPLDPQDDGKGYSCQPMGDELHAFSGGHHFMTVLIKDGIFALRPHPGVDPNGWGATVYLQPFFPGGATLTASKSLVPDFSATADWIVLNAGGQVALGSTAGYGDWDVGLRLKYSQATKTVSVQGEYHVWLSGPMTTATSDLNLCRLASNTLEDIPLLDGSTGNTGDTELIMYSGHNFAWRAWNFHLQDGHYPQDTTFVLTVRSFGAFNQVDTRRLGGLCPIQAAAKPNLDVKITAVDQSVPISFGGQYTKTKNRDPFSENLAVTPLVLRSKLKQTDRTNFSFTVDIQSSARERDGVGVLAEIAAKASDVTLGTLEVLYAESVMSKFTRSVGMIRTGNAAGKLAGSVYMPFLDSGDTTPAPYYGFFLLATPCGN